MDSSISNSGLPGGQALFNQAQFQMLRLHEIMQKVNDCWMNITGTIEGLPIYQLLFDNLTSYFLEVRATFTSAERERVEKMSDNLELLLTKYSLWSYQTNEGISSSGKYRVLNISVYYLFRKELRNYQSLILELAQNHGLGNPTKRDPTKAMAN